MSKAQSQKVLRRTINIIPGEGPKLVTTNLDALRSPQPPEEQKRPQN